MLILISLWQLYSLLSLFRHVVLLSHLAIIVFFSYLLIEIYFTLEELPVLDKMWEGQSQASSCALFLGLWRRGDHTPGPKAHLSYLSPSFLWPPSLREYFYSSNFEIVPYCEQLKYLPNLGYGGAEKWEGGNA